MRVSADEPAETAAVVNWQAKRAEEDKKVPAPSQKLEAKTPPQVRTHQHETQFSSQGSKDAANPAAMFPQEAKNRQPGVNWSLEVAVRKPNLLARFFGKLLKKADSTTPADLVKEPMKKPTVKPAFERDAQLKVTRQPVPALPPPVVRESAKKNEWPSHPEKARREPLMFPGSDERRHPRATFGEHDFPSQAHGPAQFRAAHRRCKGSVEPATFPASESRLEQYFAPQSREASFEPMPTNWPELPDLPKVAAASFAWPGAAPLKQPSEFEAGPSNWWPELNDSPTKKEHSWRALMRSVQRLQRLEKEQRGY